MALVLVIDDDMAVAHLLGSAVAHAGHRPVVETSPIAAMATNDLTKFGAVLVDFHMPHLDGIEVLHICMERSPATRRILVTAGPHEEPVREGMRAGVVQHIIAKPPTLHDIKFALAWLARS